jgi:large subunit ribosomal protein L30e
MSVKTGKILFGAVSALNSAITGKARMVIVANNCPQNVRDKIKYFCKISKIPFITFNKTSLELGRICNKPFVVSALAIRDPGDSDILEIMVNNND